MRKFTRCLLVLLLAATPLVAVIETASANTELVPAARLVAPYFDLTGSRRTLVMLTNASNYIDLISTSTGTTLATFPKGVHIEFYDKNCTRTDRTVDLSAGDVDQLDLTKSPYDLTSDALIVSKQGFIDLDVRAFDAQRDKPGIALNVLMGTVVISDFASDFSIAYPMAPSIFSFAAGHPDAAADFALAVPAAATVPTGTSGIGHVGVTHDLSGKATGWGSGYEPFPSRVFVPFYFAEGGPLSNTSQLVIAAPADGNWDGSGNGEAPGQVLPGVTIGSVTGALMDGTALIYDGCENKKSVQVTSHWLNVSLSSLGADSQSTWKTTAGANCKSAPTPTAGLFSVDEASGAYIGWVDYPNTLVSGTATGPGTGVGKPRGLVGLLIETATISGKGHGDATRLWGDPTSRVPKYSFVDFVPHDDLSGP